MEPIKSNEVIAQEHLMLGNFILNGGKHKQVIAINRDGSISLNPDIRNYVWPYECQPIPLTEEILLKCGFEWETTERNHMMIKVENVGIDIAFYYKDGIMDELQIGQHVEVVALPPIKYLHQLQNLYFTLTQTHLNIQL